MLALPHRLADTVNKDSNVADLLIENAVNIAAGFLLR
jgi:hypothetical protein